MIQLVFFLNSFLPSEFGKLDQARLYLQTNSYFQAERLYLSVEPRSETVLEQARGLTLCALNLGKPNSKQLFYQSYLTKSKYWRSVALFVLANLAAKSHDWNAFQNYGSLFLKEHAFQGTLKYRFLYYLARYTSQNAAQLDPTPLEKKWFDACRKLEKDRTFPQGVHAERSYFLQNAWLLETTTPFDIPPLPTKAPPEANYVQKLLHIRNALNTNNEYEATTFVNQLNEFEHFDEIHLHRFKLLELFFERWGSPSHVKILQTNAAKQLTRSILPFHIFPQEIKAQTDTPRANTTAVPQPEETLVQKQNIQAKKERRAITQVNPQAQKEAGGLRTEYETLERHVRLKVKGVELKLRTTSAPTTYYKIYRNYLLGLFELGRGRQRAAHEFLSMAERLIHDFPFPSLETKIFMALALYYENQRDSSTADWFRIKAIQVWNAPENLPIFANRTSNIQESPYPNLLDQELKKAHKEESIRQLLFYSESQHFMGQRRLAFLRKALSANPVFCNQIHKIGTQFSDLVADLAEKPESKSTPRRYNHILELWSKLWDRVSPYYRNASMPSLAKIQETLNRNDRVLSFIEGEQELGVLVISKSQSFAVGLGKKINYTNLSPQEQFNFLEGRLGPVWGNDGKLFLCMSPTFRQAAFLNTLKKRMAQPDKIVVTFSLKSFTTIQERGHCQNVAIYGQNASPEIQSFIDRQPQRGLVWQADLEIDPELLQSKLEDYDLFIYSGPLSLTGEGLRLELANAFFPIQKMIHSNSGLCWLILHSNRFTHWVHAIPELELLIPHAAVSIVVLKDLKNLVHVKTHMRKNGIIFL